MFELNFRFGNPSATRSEIEAAAIEADAHVFISNLPEVRLFR